MAYMHFSWSDSFQAAFSSCLPCLKSDAPSDTEDSSSTPGRAPQGHRHALFAHGIVPPPRARPDELEGLLADSDDADALSLHSNIGSDRRRKNKGKGKNRNKTRRSAPKHIRVFGYDLFGRAPAIQLPESDGEDAGAAPEGQRSRTISTDTLDSDAAPLDVAAIEELSAARHAEALAREEEERRAKEERRRRRREKRELKRAAMARALEQQTNGDEEFEGFQGSGPAYDLNGPFSPSLGSGSGSMSVSDSQEFGPFAHGQLAQPFDADAALAAAEAEADGADFGGESYTRRPRRSTVTGRSGTSDTRSSSTGTGSGSHAHAHQYAGVAPYNHQFLAQQQQHPPLPHSPLSPLSPGSDGALPSPSAASASTPNGAKKHRRKSTRPKAQSISVSVSGSSASATASQTASLVSPTASEPLAAGGPRVFAPGHRMSLSTVARGVEEEFEGFPGDLGGVQELQMDAGLGERKAGGEELPAASFPSVGLRGIQRTKSDMGVFLARRGDE